MMTDNLSPADKKTAESVLTVFNLMPPTAEKICPRCNLPFIYRSDIPKPAPKYCLLCVRR